MKVKIITSENAYDLEDQINIFIKDKMVIDIKYTPVTISNGAAPEWSPATKIFLSAMIIYK